MDSEGKHMFRGYGVLPALLRCLEEGVWGRAAEHSVLSDLCPVMQVQLWQLQAPYQDIRVHQVRGDI